MHERLRSKHYSPHEADHRILDRVVIICLAGGCICLVESRFVHVALLIQRDILVGTEHVHINAGQGNSRKRLSRVELDPPQSMLDSFLVFAAKGLLGDLEEEILSTPARLVVSRRPVMRRGVTV
jgi:hypothetical protein